MTLIYYDSQQGTPEWLAERAGKLTASSMDKILTPTKLDFSTQAKSHAMKIAAERILGKPIENINSWAMMQGHVIEENAKKVYSDIFGQVKNAGFCYDDELKIGCSVDGLVCKDGCVEVKSHPIAVHEHFETVFNDAMPNKYMLQVQTILLVTGRAWCDFISAVDGLPLFVKRIYPDAAVHEKIKEAAILFEKTVCEYVEKFEKITENMPILPLPIMIDGDD